MLLDVDAIKEGGILKRRRESVGWHEAEALHSKDLLTYDGFDQIARAADQDVWEIAKTVKSSQELIRCLHEKSVLDQSGHSGPAQRNRQTHSKSITTFAIA